MAGHLPGCPALSFIFSWERDQLAAYRILFTCSALLATHLVTSADVIYDRENSLPRPEGLQIIDPFCNPFRVLVLSSYL